MALNKINTTYEPTFSKVLARYLMESEAGLYGAQLYNPCDPRPAKPLMESLMLQLAALPGVTAEAHTYYGAVVHVTVDADSDTPDTRRKIRDIVRAHENAVRNIESARFSVRGLCPDDTLDPEAKEGPFYVYDAEKGDAIGTPSDDRATAQIWADLHNIALSHISA